MARFVGLVYMSGALGILSPYREWFIHMTPFSLLLSVVVLLWYHPVWKRWAVWWVVIAYTVGFLAEVIGVSTGLIFGDYTYGTVLGPRVWATPLLIGVNWLMVTYIANEAVYRWWAGRLPVWISTCIAALLCTALDWWIEPVAIALGFWTWTTPLPPLHNYVGWFCVSWLLAMLYATCVGTWLRNDFAPWLLGMQVLFFGFLRYFLV